MSMHAIAALVSAGLHPVSGEPRHCRNDSLAMTLGLQLAESVGAEIKVLHAGDKNNPALPNYLALNAKKIDVISMTSGTNIVDSLATNLANTDLILTGSRAEDGEDSGLVPYLLAAKLNIPLVANALAIKPIENGIEVLQFLPKGKRRSVTVKLPAVVVVHPLAPVELRVAYAQQISGQIVAHTAQNQSNTSSSKHIQWQIQAAINKPKKLKAQENKSGHERMLAYIASENKGGAVVNEGSSVEKAQVILTYLREHHLISF
jgi:electron transfer flavoprotein beta subunit